jgi:hypothetical protein
VSENGLPKERLMAEIYGRGPRIGAGIYTIYRPLTADKITPSTQAALTPALT